MFDKIFSFLGLVSGPLIFQLLRALGVGIVTYTLISASLVSIQSFVFNKVGQLPQSILSVLSEMGFLTMLAMLMAAQITALTLKFFLAPKQFSLL